MQVEIVALLSKYSVDCVATALTVFIVLLLIKKKRSVPEKINQLLPFCLAFAVYCVTAALGKISGDEVVAKSFTAGGLATVLYAFAGGFNGDKTEDLKDLIKTVLKSMVKDETADDLTERIFDKFREEGTDEDGLIAVKISELIKANLRDDADADRIALVAAVFVKAFEELKGKTVKNTKSK